MDHNTANYCEAIRQFLALEGFDAVNAINHTALDRGLITLDQFLAAARILVAAFLED